MNNILIISQARMTSTRLPGKILKEVNNKTVLDYHIQRLQQTGLDICIATTTNATDNAVEEYATTHHIKLHRGSEHNVLSRYYEAATKYNADIIIRVTSDCPLIDPHLIRNSLERYIKLNSKNIYASNGIERTFARGFDFEIFSYELLKDAYTNATDESDLEHVTPYIWKNKSGKVEFYHVKQNDNHSHLRITVDTTEDFNLIKKLIEEHKADTLPYNEIEAILLQHPELVAINKEIAQKKV